MSFLSFIVVLGILITTHELGHFLVAKALGIGVEKFSIGFPPRMFGFTKGETEYCISWIPLGGYVKLKGEGPDEVVEDPEDPKLFSSRPPLQRAAVIMAGPVMNLLFAFVVMPAYFMVGEAVPSYFNDPPVAGWVEPGSPADQSGIVPGDLIVNVEGQDTPTWERFIERTSQNTDGDLTLQVKDPSGLRTVNLDLTGAQNGRLGIEPPLDPVVGALTPGYPAQKAGVKKGDRILSLGQVPVDHWYEMARIIHASAGKSLTLKVLRGPERLSFTVTPILDEKTGWGLMGISPFTEKVVRRSGPVEAVAKGFEKNMEIMGLTFSFIGELLTGQSSIKNMGGPIMIFQVSGAAARAGLASFLWLLAFLSLQLGVLNLFPIPILDGGHLVFLAAEGILKRPLQVRTREIAQRVGLFLLLVLIIVISYNDILRIFGVR